MREKLPNFERFRWHFRHIFGVQSVIRDERDFVPDPMKRTLAAAALLVLASWTALAQPAAAPLSFEVASIKPAPPREVSKPNKIMRVEMDNGPERVTYTNVSLRNLITAAYRIKEYQLSGPDWLNNDRYNLTANTPPHTTRDQVPAMLQALLAERFQLRIHRESKELPVYALVVAKSGSKMHPSPSLDREGAGLRWGPGHLIGRGVQMKELVTTLSTLAGRPVLDMTELPGAYDVTLEFAPDATMSVAAMKMSKMPAKPAEGPDGGGSDGANGPSIFTAVQEQLGLRLEPRKAPLDIIVVDHAERVPTEN